ncbi:unnamed protein product [Angiostrongylus costaricensis]|uniref:Bestrophin homolog n=1 Tax=Angiostrongylus costaricensis TaxID=334426 RepID=A0A0R3PAF2_ANGCS|nr:unnamed protein product [Angiostrongylus costaricensis]
MRGTFISSMKIMWKSCVREGKEAIRTMFMKISRGVKFQEIADIYNRFLVSCVRQTQINVGARIIPLVSSISVYKEKVCTTFPRFISAKKARHLMSFVSGPLQMIIFITSIFVWHWFSTSVLGISTGWKYLSSLNSDIVIPTAPVLLRKEDEISCLEIQMDADIDVYLSPEQEELANVMNDFKITSSTASFASDLVSSLAG